MEGLAAVTGKADFGRNPASNEHDVRQQAAERHLGAKLLLEVPKMAASGQRLVHVLTEHVLRHNGLDFSVCLQAPTSAFQTVQDVPLVFGGPVLEIVWKL